VLGIAAAIIFLIFAKGEYRAEAPFVLEPVEKQVVPAPFDGYISKVYVEPDNVVSAGAVLAELDTVEMELQLAASQAELAGYIKQADAARRDGKTVEDQMAQAQAAKVRATIELYEYQVSQAKVRSSMAGRVIKGDLKQQIGAPVKKGDILFEVAPVERLRAVLSMPEDLIADVKEAVLKAEGENAKVKGELATAAHPDRRIPFEVERINPVAEVVNQRNVFKVRVRLTDETSCALLQSGMEGTGKIDIETKPYAWIWSRRLVNWIRMKLWL
jgi:multidrug resistance efflux pump